MDNQKIFKNIKNSEVDKNKRINKEKLKIEEKNKIIEKLKNKKIKFSQDK